MPGPWLQGSRAGKNGSDVCAIVLELLILAVAPVDVGKVQRYPGSVYVAHIR